MKKKQHFQLSKRTLGILLIALTLAYLLASAAIAQVSPKVSSNTSYSYTADPLSWGDVYSFDDAAFSGTNYSKLDGSTTSIKYYSGNQDASGTTTYSLPNYVGSIKYGNHSLSNVTAMNAHTASQFRSGVTMGTVEAPVDSSVTIPVATTTGTGIYSVVPGSTGSYVVYVYSPSGAPSNVKYSLINSYTAANSYSGAPATALTFTQIGSTGWYSSNAISVGNLGWTAYNTTGFSTGSDTSNSGDSGQGTFTGSTLTNTTLNSTTYYHNNWKATAVNFDTVLCVSFPSSVKLGPITRADGTFSLTNDNTKGTVSVQNIFGVDVGTSYNGNHMPLFISATPLDSEYSFTGVEGGSVSVVREGLYRFDFEGAASLTAKWEKMVNLPTVTVNDTTLNAYFSPTGNASFQNGTDTPFTFTADFSDAVDGATLSYAVTGSTTGIDTSGTLTESSNSFELVASFDSVTVTFTATGDGVSKTMTYTITGNNNGLSKAARIGTSSGTNEYWTLEDALVASNNGTSGNIYVIGNYKMYSGEHPKTAWTALTNGVQKRWYVKSGVTLVVPHSTDTTVLTNSNITNSGNAISDSSSTEYRRLTITSGNTLTVAGSVSVGSKVLKSGSASQAGPYGLIYMDAYSHINFLNGSKLYCFGFIKGDGSMEMANGSAVYEIMKVEDYPGSASNMSDLKDAGVFPFSKFSVQNVAVRMTLDAGATLDVLYTLYGTVAGYHTTWVHMIDSLSSSNKALFKTDTSVMFAFINGRQYIELNGNSSISDMTISISSFSVSTSDLAGDLIPYNFTITVTSGTTDLGENVILSKGSELVIDQGATVTVKSGKKLYAIASEDDPQAVGTQPDAKVDINGTIEVTGQFMTSSNIATIVSSEHTGKVVFKSAPTASGTVKLRNSSTTGASVAVVPAQLQNGDGTYVNTTPAQNGWTFNYDPDYLQWYRYLVEFQLNGNTVGKGFYNYDSDPATYDASWLTDLSATVTSGSATVAINEGIITATGVSADTTIAISGVVPSYTPIFVLDETQYAAYNSFTDNEIAETVEIDGKTHYVVQQAASEMEVGTTLTPPSNASLGVDGTNPALTGFFWNMSGTRNGGDGFLGVVPVGGANHDPVYIYGFYTGYVAYNSFTEEYYDTLQGAMRFIADSTPTTITLFANCGTFVEEDASALLVTTSAASTSIIDLNGFKGVGRIVNKGSMTIELNGGSLEYRTGATAAAATYKGMAAISNSGTMTITDSVGGGKITSDATSNASGADGSAVIRNNAGATLTVTGKDAEHLLKIFENQTEVAYNSSYGYYAYNYGIYNLGHITALTNVEITTAHSRTTGVNVYNYNTGVIDLITGSHFYAYSGSSVFNYGGTITTITGTTIDGKNGVANYNVRTGAQASGWTVANADKGIIDTITNCHIEVGQYAIYNNAVINTISSNTLIAHPDTPQVDTRGDGLATASETNTTAAYTVYNSGNWWYNTNVWKRVDTTSAPFTRTDTYKEEEQYRPTIGQIIDCEIYAENTTTSASYGDYALVNSGGVINKIGGTTNIKTYKHPDSTATITTSHYAMQNLAGGIIKSIEGTVNISATGIGTVYNTGVFTTKTVNTYNGKIGGNVTNQVYDYGDPSYIQSITCAGTWSCGSYYALYNTGYIKTINAPGLTIKSATSGYNVLYNSYETVNNHLEYYCDYTDPATASTAYHRHAAYTKNTEKSCRIDTLSGVTIQGKYNVLVNGGKIGTLSNVTVETLTTSNDPTFVNGANDTNYGRYASVTEDRKNVASYVSDYPHVTISAGYATRYDRDWTYIPASIDVIDNLTLTSTGQYALRNNAHIGALKNSTITATTSYALHNNATGPLTEKQSVQYYSGTSIWATTKYTSEYAKHYERDPASIDLIDNCTISTGTGNYTAYNSGHIGTIKNSTFTAGETTAAAYALANMGNTELEYTRDCLDDFLYVTANGGTACTGYGGTGGETNVVVYDYDAPSIDLIGEGNTFTATTPVIANTGIITAIDSGDGTLTTITGSKAQGNTIYNYSAGLDARTTTTPYTAAETLPASGTKGTAVNDDTLLSGARIGTIKNVYINANGYGILNGDASTGKLPVIGEIGEGTEIYAHCTAAGYHAIANQNYAEITSITGGFFKVTKATTNAYRNGYSAEGNAEHATVISGGYFQGASNTRDNAIFLPDSTDRQTYATGKKLSSGTKTPTPVHTDTMGGNYYYIADSYTVTFEMGGHGTAPADQPVESGQNATAPTGFTAYDPNDQSIIPTTVTDNGVTYRFDGWYTDTAFITAFDFTKPVTSENFTVSDGTVTAYARWTELQPVAQIGTAKYLSLAAAVTAAQNGDTITMLADETLNALVDFTGKSVTLDLNGHTVSRNGTALRVQNGGTLTLKDSGDDGKVLVTGVTVGYGDAIVIQPGGTFTLESGTIQSNAYGILSGSTATVTGGTVIGGTSVLSAVSSGTIAVSGGWFSHAVNSAYCATGYHPATDTEHDPQYTVSNIWTVTFNMQGHGTAPDAQSVVYGGKATEPIPTPTEEGWTFGGWYKEDTLETEWNFSTDIVTADTTLYAKWTLTGFTVTFVLNDGVIVTGKDPIVRNGVASGSKISAPGKDALASAAPEGYAVEGWYTDSETAWRFSADVVTADTTLYAKWERAAETTVNYILRQTGDNGYETTEESFTYIKGEELTPPEYMYYTFDGWTYDGKTYSNSAELRSVLDAALEDGVTTLDLTANFSRESYTVKYYSWIQGVDEEPYDEEQPVTTQKLGGSVQVHTVESFEGYYFQYWLIVPSSEVENMRVDETGKLVCGDYAQCKTTKYTFFAPESDDYYAVAYFGNTQPNYNVNEQKVALRITNESNQKVGQKNYVAVTLEMTGLVNGNTLVEAGVYYTTEKSADDIEKFGKRYEKKLKELVDADKKGGATYTMRWTLDDASKNLYLYAYEIYQEPGGTEKTVYYAYSNKEMTETPVAYDEIIFRE